MEQMIAELLTHATAAIEERFGKFLGVAFVLFALGGIFLGIWLFVLFLRAR